MPIKIGPKEVFLEVDEFAFLVGLSPDPIYRMIRKEQLKAFRLTFGGKWKIPSSELEKFGLSYGRE